MIESGINYYSNVLNVPAGTLSVFYSFLTGTGAIIPSVTPSQSIFSGNMNSGCYLTPSGAYFIQSSGSYITINNTTGLNYPNYTIIISEQCSTSGVSKVGGTLLSSLSTGTISSGFSIGINNNNQLYFFAYDNNENANCYTLNDFVGAKNVFTCSIRNQAVELGYYNFNTNQIESQSYFINYPLIFNPNWYLGNDFNGLPNSIPFNGWIDGCLIFNTNLSKNTLTNLCSGFFAYPSVSALISGSGITGQVTGYFSTLYSVTGITGYQNLYSGNWTGYTNDAVYNLLSGITGIFTTGSGLVFYNTGIIQCRSNQYTIFVYPSSGLLYSSNFSNNGTDNWSGVNGLLSGNQTNINNPTSMGWLSFTYQNPALNIYTSNFLTVDGWKANYMPTFNQTNSTSPTSNGWLLETAPGGSPLRLENSGISLISGVNYRLTMSLDVTAGINLSATPYLGVKMSVGAYSSGKFTSGNQGVWALTTGQQFADISFTSDGTTSAPQPEISFLNSSMVEVSPALGTNIYFKNICFYSGTGFGGYLYQNINNNIGNYYVITGLVDVRYFQYTTGYYGSGAEFLGILDINSYPSSGLYQSGNMAIVPLTGGGINIINTGYITINPSGGSPKFMLVNQYGGVPGFTGSGQPILYFNNLSYYSLTSGYGVSSTGITGYITGNNILFSGSGAQPIYSVSVYIQSGFSGVIYSGMSSVPLTLPTGNVTGFNSGIFLNTNIINSYGMDTITYVGPLRNSTNSNLIEYDIFESGININWTNIQVSVNNAQLNFGLPINYNSTGINFWYNGYMLWGTGSFNTTGIKNQAPQIPSGQYSITGYYLLQEPGTVSSSDIAIYDLFFSGGKQFIISGTNAGVIYTGTLVSPNPLLFLNGQKLYSGVDYIISGYLGNANDPCIKIINSDPTGNFWMISQYSGTSIYTGFSVNTTGYDVVNTGKFARGSTIAFLGGTRQWPTTYLEHTYFDLVTGNPIYTSGTNNIYSNSQTFIISQ